METKGPRLDGNPRIYLLRGDPKAFNSTTERREARGEQGTGWGPNTSYKWGELTALKEVKKLQLPLFLKPICRDF